MKKIILTGVNGLIGKETIEPLKESGAKIFALVRKKNTAIVLGGTSNHICAMALVVMDIKKYSPNLADEIVIFYDSVGGG